MSRDLPIFFFLLIIVIALFVIASIVGFIKDNKKEIGNVMWWLLGAFMVVCFLASIIMNCNDRIKRGNYEKEKATLHLSLD